MNEKFQCVQGTQKRRTMSEKVRGEVASVLVWWLPAGPMSLSLLALVGACGH